MTFTASLATREEAPTKKRKLGEMLEALDISDQNANATEATLVDQLTKVLEKATLSEKELNDARAEIVALKAQMQSREKNARAEIDALKSQLQSCMGEAVRR